MEQIADNYWKLSNSGGYDSWLRAGEPLIAFKPFTHAEEWITVEEFAKRMNAEVKLFPDGRTFHITKVDMESKTVTLAEVTPEGR